MTFHWADLLVIAVSVGAGYALCYAGLRRWLRLAVAGRQQATERQLDVLTGALKALEGKVAELGKPVALQAAAEAEVVEIKADAPPSKHTAHFDNGDVPPEILAVIAAAANAFMGRKTRILSAKLLQLPQEAMNPWSQQGRVFVQASHNLRSRS